MAALALGSDGGGSIRYPAGLTGLVGLKPQRDRIPVGAEHHSGWHRLLVLGPLSRSVRDAALCLDIAAEARNASVYRDAVRARREGLHIAVSTNAPPGTNVSLSTAGRLAVETASTLLAELGHRVIEVDLDYRGLACLWNSTVRLLKGVQDDVATMPDRRVLEHRTRAVARLGSLLPARLPRGAMRSLRRANTSAWLAPWNVIGQPGIAVPVGTDEDGMPTAVHLAGRARDEAALLALAAEIEANRPFPKWADAGASLDA